MENKTAVITGATSGIGAADAARFAEEGYVTSSSLGEGKRKLRHLQIKSEKSMA